MIKSNLPVILLKNLVLLPYQEIRVELKNEISKRVTEISKLYHDSEVLVVCPLDPLEENPDTSDLPKVGVVGKIKNIIELPNGNMRLLISGLYRVKIIDYVNYSNESEVLDAIITRLYINVLLNENIAWDDEFLGELYKLRVDMTLPCFSCGMYTIVDDVDNVFYEILDLAFYEENDYIDLEKCYAIKNVYLEFKGTIWHLSYTETPYHGPEEFEISFEDTGEKVFERKFRYEVKE